MQSHLLALYAGPDQVMTVTSGFASALGVFLIFWNRLRATLAIVLAKIEGVRKTTAAQPALRNPSQNS